MSYVSHRDARWQVLDFLAKPYAEPSWAEAEAAMDARRKKIEASVVAASRPVLRKKKTTSYGNAYGNAYGTATSDSSEGGGGAVHTYPHNSGVAHSEVGCKEPNTAHAAPSPTAPIAPQLNGNPALPRGGVPTGVTWRRGSDPRLGAVLLIPAHCHDAGLQS